MVFCRRTIAADGDLLFYRRRECMKCKERFATYEGYERPDTTAEEKLRELNELLAQVRKLLCAPDKISA